MLRVCGVVGTLMGRLDLEAVLDGASEPVDLFRQARVQVPRGNPSGIVGRDGTEEVPVYETRAEEAVPKQLFGAPGRCGKPGRSALSGGESARCGTQLPALSA